MCSTSRPPPSPSSSPRSSARSASPSWSATAAACGSRAPPRCSSATPTSCSRSSRPRRPTSRPSPTGSSARCGSRASRPGWRRSPRRPPPRCGRATRGSRSSSRSRRRRTASCSSGAATSTSRSRWPRARRRRPTTRASTSAPLRSDTLDAVLPEGHPLAALDEVPLAALAGEPFVGPPDGTSCHDVTVTGCASAGFAPAFAHRSLDFHTTMALVAAGLGVALVPRLAQAAVPAGAAIRPLEAPGARPARLRRDPRRRRAPPDGRRGARRARQLRISLSTSSRLASMSARETRLSRHRRR